MIEIRNSVIKLLNNNLYAVSLYFRQIVGTLVLFVIAHYLSVYDYGLFSSYKSIVTFWFLFANMEFANYILVSSNANVKEVKLKISLFLINAIFIGLLIALVSTFSKIENHFLFYLVILRTFFDGVFFGLMLPYFQAADKFKTIGQINIIYSTSIAIIAIISYILKLSLIKFLILNICLGFINFLQCSYFAKINYFLVFTNLKRLIKKIDKSIFAYAGSTITDYMYAQTSTLYVAMFLNKEQAALFFAAYTIANISALFSAAQVQKMLPELIKTEPKNIKSILDRNAIILLSILGFILLFLIFAGKYVLLFLYGQQYYKNALPVLIVLFAANILIAYGGLHGTVITALGHQAKKIPMKMETAIITIIFLFILNKYSIYGAALALLISSIYVSIRFAKYSFNLIKNTTNY